jgi:trehalose 6-phosphate phosphatase
VIRDDPPPLSIFAGATPPALFLDFDGTLVELAETPDSVTLPRGLADLLARLARGLEGRLAILSGRSLADLERHLGPGPFAVSGSHGLELRLARGLDLPVAAPALPAAARRAALRFAEGKDGLLVEVKPAGLAIHYRRAPEREAEVAEFAARLAAECGLRVQNGKMVAELRPAGADKGDALRALMREPIFAGARPWFMGDDLTDEDGFAAAAELGGGGVLVGSARPSAARWRLPDVEAAARWLEAVAAGTHAARHG